MRFLNKDFFIKFFIVDIVFFSVFYITFIKTFPINEIVESNKNEITEKMGKIIKYKNLYIGYGLTINFDDLEIISIPKDDEKSKNNVKNNRSMKKNTTSNLIKTKDSKNKKEDNKKSKTKEEKVEPIKLTIKNLSIKPNIMKIISSKKLNIDFDADLLGGTIKGNFTVVSDDNKLPQKKLSKNRIKPLKIEKNQISITLESINLIKLSKYFELKLPYNGKLTGDISTIFATRMGKPIISDLSLDLNVKNGEVGPGKVKAMGGFVTVDAIKMGSFDIKGETPRNSSRFKLVPLKIDSTDLKADLDGYITFSRSIMPDLKLKFKFTDTLLKTNKKIKSVLTGITNLKRKDGYYGVKLTGTVEHLNQRPWIR